jgi:hypothetical protein
MNIFYFYNHILMNYAYKLHKLWWLLLLLVSLLYMSIKFKIIEEKFTNNGHRNWSDDLISRFNIYQKTVNKNMIQYDLDILQKQASPEEAEELIKTGFWPWSNDIKELYVKQVWSSPIIKSNPKQTLEYAMKIYNEKAVTELLAWNTKEGNFLLYGGDLGTTDNLVINKNNTLMCDVDINGKSIMRKKVYTGANLWNGYMNTITTNIKNEDIPKVMSGFSFENSPCNPCAVLNDNSNYSCPFKLNINGDNSISEPWKILWGLK